MSIPPDVTLLESWQTAFDPDALPRELRREICSEHSLNGVEAHAVAVRKDRDDVLFEIAGGETPLAVVHLTWARQKESLPWPTARYFRSWQHWLEECMLPDHEEYTAS